ncbi:rhodanese-like domain-containing protein [Aurantivibrio plasticivorans]
MKYLTKAIMVCVLLKVSLFSMGAFASDDIWIDVRTEKEWNSGHLEQAVHIPYDEITGKIAAITEDKDAPIKLYCRSGGRAGKAEKALEEMGYTNVQNMGGIEDAKKFLADK